MKPIQKALKRAFITALILTVAFVGGIPAIVFGAIHRWWILMAFGIVCTVAGFYGCPIAWINYGGVRSLARLVSAIVDEYIYSVQGLSAQLSLSEKETRRRLDKCFQKRYLLGYRREGDNIVINEGTALDKKQFAAECPNCGAKFLYTRDDPRCPYCNSPVTKDEQ